MNKKQKAQLSYRSQSHLDKKTGVYLWYYEKPAGIEVWSIEFAPGGGYVGTIPWWKLRASLNRYDKARKTK